MKKRILLLSALLLTATVTTLQLQAREVKVTKTNGIKTGDPIKLNEYETTNDGIRYKTVPGCSGTGKPPVRGDDLTVHYCGYFPVETMNKNKVMEYSVGKKFDSSRDRDQTFKFKVGMRQVIPGWDKMLATMKKGERRIIILPSKEAYGNRATGSIPANSSLIFDVELISIG